jgi:hypothetical protein
LCEGSGGRKRGEDSASNEKFLRHDRLLNKCSGFAPGNRQRGIPEVVSKQATASSA